MLVKGKSDTSNQPASGAPRNLCECRQKLGKSSEFSWVVRLDRHEGRKKALVEQKNERKGLISPA